MLLSFDFAVMLHSDTFQTRQKQSQLGGIGQTSRFQFKPHLWSVAKLRHHCNRTCSHSSWKGLVVCRKRIPTGSIFEYRINASSNAVQFCASLQGHPQKTHSRSFEKDEESLFIHAVWFRRCQREAFASGNCRTWQQRRCRENRAWCGFQVK